MSLEQMQRLLASDDAAFRAQGVELVRALGDVALFDALTDGCEWTVRSAADGSAVGYVELRCEPGTAAASIDAGALLAVVMHAPAEAKVAAGRAAVTHWYVPNLGGAFELDWLSSFPRLSALHIAWGWSFAAASGESVWPGVRWLTLQGGFPRASLEEAFAVLPGLRALTLRGVEVTSVDVTSLRDLEVLTLADVPSVTELVGAEALANLKLLRLSPKSGLSEACRLRLSAGTTTRAGLDALAAKTCVEREAFGEAREACERVLAVRQTPEDYALRAQVRAKLRDDAGAVEDYTRAIASSPEPNADFYEDRAHAWRRLGKFEEASLDYERAIALGAPAKWTLLHAANVLREAGRHEDAVKAYGRMLTLEGQLGEWTAYASARRGAARAMCGERGLAMADFDRSLAVRGGYAEALEGRAGLWLSLGRPELARADAARCLAIEAKREGARECLARAEAQVAEGAAESVTRFARVEEALHGYAWAPPETQMDVARAWVAEVGSSLDALLPVTFDADGIVRHGASYGVLAALPHTDRELTPYAADFVRSVIAVAPEGSGLAAARSTVTSLFVGGPELDARALRAFGALRRLWIEEAGVYHPEVLAELGIEVLGLCHLDARTLFEVLPSMTSLREVRLRRLRRQVPMSAIASLRSVQVVDVDFVSYGGDVAELEGMPELRALHVPAHALLGPASPAFRAKIHRHRT